MKPSTVQTHLKNLVLSAAPLAAYGDPFVFTPFQAEGDDKAYAAALNARLREKGVCIEIGYPQKRAVKSPGRGQARVVTLDVFVGESLKTAHAPFDQELTEAVDDAITQQVDSYTERFDLEAEDHAISEKGYVLHVLTYSITVPKK